VVTKTARAEQEIVTTAASKAAAAARRGRREARVRAGFIKQFQRRRLLLVASLYELASVAALEGERIGCDGMAPEIVDAPGPGDNPQLRVARNVREHPLDLMWHKGQISREQFAAGEMLRRDLELALISPMTGRSFENIYATELSNKAALREAGLSEMLGPKTFVPPKGKTQFVWNDLSDVRLDAIDRNQKARAAMTSREGADAAEIVVAFLREARTVQEVAAMRDNAGSPRFGARHSVGRKLQRGLDALAAHYGLTHRGRDRACWVHPYYADAPGSSGGEPAGADSRVATLEKGTRV